MKLASWGLVILAATFCCQLSAQDKSGFTLASPDIHEGGMLPQRFVLGFAGCTGGNVSPGLQWLNVPRGTKSFAITVFDTDETSSPSGWWHWVVYDLPAATRSVPTGAGDKLKPILPAGAIQGRSDAGTNAYNGACTKKGAPAHRYVFTVYALSVDKVPMPTAHASGAMLNVVAEEFILAKATLTARYSQ